MFRKETKSLVELKLKEQDFDFQSTESLLYKVMSLEGLKADKLTPYSGALLDVWLTARANKDK